MSENRDEILNKLFHQIILASELLDNLQTDRKSVAENFAFGGELSTNSEYWRHCQGVFDPLAEYVEAFSSSIYPIIVRRIKERGKTSENEMKEGEEA